MNRLIEKMVFSGLVTACRFATWPTRRSPDLVNPTTDGVMRLPSGLVITTGSPPSITATTELVVPRSIPIILLILRYLATAPVVGGGNLYNNNSIKCARHRVNGWQRKYPRKSVLYCGLPACLSGLSAAPGELPTPHSRFTYGPPTCRLEGVLLHHTSALDPCVCAGVPPHARGAGTAGAATAAEAPALTSHSSTASPSSSATAGPTMRRRACRCSPAIGCAPAAAASRSCSPTAPRCTSITTPSSTCSPTNSSG